MDAYSSLFSWDLVGQQLAVLAFLQAKYAPIISPRKRLPEDYIKALLTLQYTLDQLQKGPTANLKHGLPASPDYRSVFDREPQQPGTNVIVLKGGGGTEKMFWLFSRLWDEQQLFFLGFPTVMDELEKVIQSDPKEKQKISSWTARVFAELGMIVRARHELDIYMPWAAGFENDILDHKESIQKEFAQKFAAIADLDHHLKSAQFAKTGDPFGATFHYPSDKRRTQQNVESMRSAELNLDVFWKTIDSHYQKKCGKTIHLAFQHLLTDNSPLDRTAEWVEPIKGRAEPKASMHIENMIPHVAGLSIGSPEPAPKSIPQQPKVKPKTRGAARTDPTDTLEAPTEQELKTEPTFTATARAFKAFKTLFYTPSTTDLPGEVS